MLHKPRKRTFCDLAFLGSSLVCPRFFLGLLPEGHWEGTRGRNLNKSTFINTHTFGGCAYPVRHYPIAIRLRTLAFGNMVAMIVDPVNIRATCTSALPTYSRSSWGPHNIYSAILCIALNPQSGYFSGAILGVRSVALLHLALLLGRYKGSIREGNLKISALCA